MRERTSLDLSALGYGAVPARCDRPVSTVTGRTEVRTRLDDMTIGQLSELVGVPVPTLRSWERRYRIPTLTRTDGTTRRYSLLHAQMLSLMRDDVARGIRAAEAADSVRELFDADRAGAPFVLGLLDACESFDAAGVGRWLDRASAELGLGPCLDEVLFPAMRRIGLSWQTNQYAVDHERATTEAVCRWLRCQAKSDTLSSGMPLVLLAPTDRHNVGLHALAVLLHQRQLRCAGLPGGLSSAGLRAELDAKRPAAVVLLSHLPAARDRAVARLHVLRDSGTEVFYAGNAFASSRSRRAVPGRYVGLSLQHAAELIETSVRTSATRTGVGLDR